MKIKRIYGYVFLSICIMPFLAFTCADRVDGGHKRITFVNNSEDTVYVSKKRLIKIAPSDTLYDCLSKEIKAPKGGSCSLEPMNNYWETDFKVIPYIQFFVYPQYTSFYGSCSEARKYQLKRYQLTEEDLERMNWTITYP